MASTTDALAERYDELTVTIENLRQLDRECAGPEEGFRACNVLTNRFAQGACPVRLASPSWRLPSSLSALPRRRLPGDARPLRDGERRHGLRLGRGEGVLTATISSSPSLISNCD